MTSPTTAVMAMMAGIGSFFAAGCGAGDTVSGVRLVVPVVVPTWGLARSLFLLSSDGYAIV